MRYSVVLTPEPDGSAANVTVPAMPGVLTWARTSEEALETAREAVELHLEGFAERGLPFPADRKPRRNTSRAKDNGCRERGRRLHEDVTIDLKLAAPSVRSA